MKSSTSADQGSRHSARLSVLLLCDDRAVHTNTVRDHIAAFSRFSRHRVQLFNPVGRRDSRFLDFDEFDVVVVHFSLFLLSDYCLPPAFRHRLQRYRGLKVLFRQDDYHWVDEAAERIRELGVEVLFTAVPAARIAAMYGDRLPGVTCITTLTGYVPERLVRRPVLPIGERPIDIGYRTLGTLPYWLGRLSQDKVLIAQGVLARAPRYGLRCDIAWTSEARIYGERWNNFVASCRTMLGTESGASIADFDGSIERGVKRYLLDHPGAGFDEVFRAVLSPHEGNVVVNVVSPRVFEAAALRTPLVLFPGEYSGVVEPWRHYVPLEKDFSNFSDVVERVRDTPFLTELATRVYEEIVASGRYSHRSFVAEFDDVVEEHGPQRASGSLRSYRLARAEARVRAPGVFLAQRLHRRGAWMVGRRAAQAYLALRSGLTSAGSRDLLRRYVADHELRRKVSLRAVLDDLLKLSALGRAHASELDATGLAVVAEFEPHAGRLSLQARPAVRGLHRDGDEPHQPDAVRRALLERQIREIVSFSPAERAVLYPLNRFKSVHVALGDDRGVHRFDALTELARRFPVSAWESLAPVLGGAVKVSDRSRGKD